LVLLLAGFVVALLPLWSVADEEPVSALYEAAKKEGQVNVYGSMQEWEVKYLLDLFQKMYPGVKVQYIRASETDLVGRIFAESKAGAHNFDILITTAAHQAKAFNLAMKYRPIEARAVPAEFKDKDGYWTAVYLNTNVIQYNTKLVKPADVPKSYEDLANPKWKGKITLEDSDFEWFWGYSQSLGVDKAMALFKKITATNGITVVNGHGKIADLVAAGEYPIAINNYAYTIERLKQKGAPLEWVAVEPVVTILAPVVIAAKSPHPNAAKLYANFVLSKAGQEEMKKRGRIPTRSDVDPDPPRLLKGLKLKVLTPPLDGAELNRAKKAFREAFGISR